MLVYVCAHILLFFYLLIYNQSMRKWVNLCYYIKPVRKEEGKSYWKIPLCDDDATREK